MSSAPNVSYLVYTIWQDIWLGIANGVGLFWTIDDIEHWRTVGWKLAIYLVSLVNLVDLILVQWYHHKDVHEKFLKMWKGLWILHLVSLIIIGVALSFWAK